MKNGKSIRVAMLVVDGNDVAGDQFRKLGHPSPSVHPAIQGVLDGLSSESGVECHVLYGTLNGRGEEFRRVGNVIYTSVPYRRLPFPGMGYVGRLFALLKKLKSLNPDLVHAQGTERECAVAAVLAGFPSLVTLHGNFREISKIMAKGMLDYYRIMAWMETWTLQRVGGIICISNYVREITSGFKAKKWVVPNPVLDLYLSMERPVPPATPRVICMGSIDPRKQTILILEACEFLWEEGLDFEFHVYGSNGYAEDYSTEFLQRLKAWEKNGRAFNHGMVRNPGPAIASAKVMISASSEESFGMNVLEAMALGTPVVAPALGGIVDILGDQKTGLFYQANDSGDCARKIKEILQNPSLWKKFSEQGRQKAAAGFSPRLVASKTYNVYREFLGLPLED